MSNDSISVLAVDDNEDALFALERMLSHNGYQVYSAKSGVEALELLRSEDIDILLLDVMMPEMDGYEVTRQMKADERLRYIPVILVTAKSNLEDIVYGLDQGADDYITKPFKQDELIARLNAVVRMKSLYQELRDTRADNRALRIVVQRATSFDNIIGNSRAMQRVFDVMEKVVNRDVPVLILGESGTGKEVVAQALHFNSARKDRRLISQNCSAFSDTLLESELFGHEKGAFSGADSRKEGLFSAADGGTFFLDELGDMSINLQARLLRVLESGTFYSVGGTKERQVDVRLIAATNRNLPELIDAGKFREDLYYRLNVVKIELPPLRERKEDIPLLIDHLLARACEKNRLATKQVDKAALKILCDYDWPGNVRQLAHEIERMLIFAGDEDVLGAELVSVGTATGGGASLAGNTNKRVAGQLKDAMEQLEREMITATLEQTGWNKSETARVLGISRSNLIAKIQGYGLEE